MRRPVIAATFPQRFRDIGGVGRLNRIVMSALDFPELYDLFLLGRQFTAHRNRDHPVKRPMEDNDLARTASGQLRETGGIVEAMPD